MRPEVSIIIPCYNEGDVLEESIERVRKVMGVLKYEYELILIDDYSTDGTRKRGAKLAKKYKRVKWFENDRNIGRGGTVSRGARLARGRIVGYLDADLEVSEIYIPYAIACIDGGADIATAKRVYKIGAIYLNPYLMVRLITHLGYKWLVRHLLKSRINDTESGFKFFDRERLICLLDKVEDAGWFWDTEVSARATYMGYHIDEFTALFVKRTNVGSSVRIANDVKDYFRKLLAFRKLAKGNGWV